MGWLLEQMDRAAERDRINKLKHAEADYYAYISNVMNRNRGANALRKYGSRA
jgi:hypothetical protein